MSETITTVSALDYRAGDIVEIVVQDKRWWRKLWYFMTFRKHPYRKVYRIINTIGLDRKFSIIKQGKL